MAATPIEAYPHLTQKICALWGTWELEDFVQHLILDSRDGGRQGFPMEVAAELLFLAQCNKTLRTLVLAKQLGVRYDEASRTLEAGDHARQGTSHWSDPSVAKDVAKDVAKTTATSSAITSSSAFSQQAAARTSRAPVRKGAAGGQSGGKVVGLLLFRILPILVLALVAWRYLQRLI